MKTRSELTEDQFKDLYAFLSIIGTQFKDFTIVQGWFRSRTDDLTCLVETHFECFDGMDFALNGIKAFVRMLSTLDKTSSVEVTVDDESVFFSDGQVIVDLKKIRGSFNDNPFIPEEEIKRIYFDQVDNDERPIIRETIHRSVVSKFGKMCRHLQTNVVTIRQQKGDPRRGYLVVEEHPGYGPSGSSNRYTVGLKTGFITPIKEGAHMNIANLPYFFNKSDVTLEVKRCTDPKIVAIMHKVAVGDLSITIFGRASLVEESDE